jgi:hypothetical protein
MREGEPEKRILGLGLGIGIADWGGRAGEGRICQAATRSERRGSTGQVHDDAGGRTREEEIRVRDIWIGEAPRESWRAARKESRRTADVAGDNDPAVATATVRR